MKRNAQANNTPKTHRAWSLYDWANSAYNLVITSTIFPAYYIAITSNPATQDKVKVGNWEIVNSALLQYTIALAYLIIVFISPILSAIADLRGNKKKFMRFFTTLGALSCCGLFFFTEDAILLGLFFSLLAAVGYCGSLVFYNAYLPEIAAPHEQDKLSAKGFAYGYVGSVILQIVCLIIIFLLPSESLAVRISFLLVGIWWLVFSAISFRGLPQGKPKAVDVNKKSILKYGFEELAIVWRKIKQQPVLLRYLPAFFFYSMGVQTVMLAAAEFGKKEIYKEVDGERIPLSTNELIISILLIQVVAILGAMGMAKLSEKWGNIRVLMFTVVLWIVICGLAYYSYSDLHFYGLAILVGIVMGGIQSLSRSTYAKFIPKAEKDVTAYFSFYDVCEKLSIVIGMFTFGFIEHVTGEMRPAILSLAVFFVIGLILLGFANYRIKQSTRMELNV